MSKMIFMKYLPPVRPKLVPKLKKLRIYWNLSQSRFWCENLIFIKHVPLVWPKLIPKLKLLRIYWNLAHSIFQIYQSGFWCQKYFLWNIYQAKLTPRLRLLWNLCLIFQVFQSWQWDLIKVSLNIYYMLCRNRSPILNSNIDYKMRSNLYEIHTGFVYYYP